MRPHSAWDLPPSTCPSLVSVALYLQSKLWTLCCTDISEVAGSSVVYLPGPCLRDPGVPFPGMANFCLSVLLYCCQIFAFLVLFCHVIHSVLVWFLKPVPLSENDGTLDQQLEACRSMPQHATACRSVPRHAAAHRSEPKFSWGLLVPIPNPPSSDTSPSFCRREVIGGCC